MSENKIFQVLAYNAIVCLSILIRLEIYPWREWKQIVILEQFMN